MDTALTKLSEQQLLQVFSELVGRDRVNTAQLLAHIGEVDERMLWAKHACSSMFAFCTERFHMSESTAAKRIWAARTARRFPAVLTMVARGELHLSAINLLAKHLTEGNHVSVLARAKHKTTREIERLAAELAPRPDVASRVRALPMPAGTAAPVRRAGAKLHKTVVPLAPRRFKIEVTIDENTHNKLRALQDLLRHQIPNADPAAIVSRALEALLEDTLKKKAALTARPKRTSGKSATRAVPATIRREVWKRDRGRCAFRDEHGRRCRATACVEYHHETPYGKGGRHEVGNIALRCRAHNQYQADLDYGRSFMRERRGAQHSAWNAGKEKPR